MKHVQAKFCFSVLFSHIKRAENVTCVLIHKRFTAAIKNKDAHISLRASTPLALNRFLPFQRRGVVNPAKKLCAWSQTYNLILKTMSHKNFQPTYFGGQSVSSRNSSILLISVFTSPLKVRKGGCVPGARLCRSAGFLWSSTEKWSSGKKRQLCRCKEPWRCHWGKKNNDNCDHKLAVTIFAVTIY